MLERLLSRTAFKIYLGAILLSLVIILLMLFTHNRIVLWLNEWQAVHLFKGYFYPELTMLILLVPMGMLAYGLGLLYDRITWQGVFAHPDEAAELPGLADPPDRVSYHETTRREIIDEVRTRFQEPMGQLRPLGFTELCYHSETIPWLGLRLGGLGFFGALGLLANEVTRWGPRLTVSGFFPLMVARDEFTYATIFGRGVSFYTGFTDGTLLISSNFEGIEINDEAQKLHKAPVPAAIPQAWEAHKQRVEEMGRQGKMLSGDLSFGGYRGLSARVDEYVMKQGARRVQPASQRVSPGATLLSTLVGTGVVAFLTLLVLFALNLLAALQSGWSCESVRGILVISYALQLAGVFAGLGLSWLLAWAEPDSPALMNGWGTKLFRNEPALDEQGGYVATKWLSIFGLPLLPVRSYRVLSGGALPAGVVRLKRQKQLSWAQVRATATAAWPWYLLLAVLLLAFPLWALVKCA